MCGIAGEVNFYERHRTPEETFETMKQLLKRRGPNQDGIYKTRHATLVHTRLSVVDPEHGIQPMKTEHGGKRYCLIYNGELYNTDELRSQLAAKGCRFESRSDTEVLLKAYAAWGEGCVDRLNGIFAFAVWEETGETLFVARDRMGVKPFFFALVDNVFIFGSEIKALLAHPLVKPEIDLNGLSELFLLGPGRTPGCGVFRKIHELRAGQCGHFTRAGFSSRYYWTPTDTEHKDNLSQTVEKVRYLVLDSIERQLVSDVPIATFLSGGLDSSIISAAASAHLAKRGERLKSFSVDYFDNAKYFTASKFQPNSDDYYIDVMTSHLGSEHRKVIVDTPELVDALFTAVEARDLPGMADVDSSLVLFCKRVKEEATVALSGECADEIFGGYPWYRDETIRMIDGFPWSQSTAYRYSFLRPELAERIDPQAFVYSRYRATVKSASKRPDLSPVEERMKEMMKLNLDWFMQTLLDRKDRMSMYNGLEVRVPFCDYRIVEYLYGVPWEMKNYDNREKGLLRLAMTGLLPDEILWRKKSPYPKTHHPAYLAAVSALLRDILDDPSSPLLTVAKPEALEELLKAQVSTPWYGQLMTTPQTIAYFVQMNFWMKRYKVTLAQP